MIILFYSLSFVEKNYISIFGLSELVIKGLLWTLILLGSSDVMNVVENLTLCVNPSQIMLKITKVTIYSHLLCAEHSAKFFSCTNENPSLGQILDIPWRHWVTKSLSHQCSHTIVAIAECEPRLPSFRTIHWSTN